jgi:hypothetical protein
MLYYVIIDSRLSYVLETYSTNTWCILLYKIRLSSPLMLRRKTTFFISTLLGYWLEPVTDDHTFVSDFTRLPSDVSGLVPTTVIKEVLL